MTKKKASEGSYRGQGRGPCLQESLVERDLYHLDRLDSKKTPSASSEACTEEAS